MKKKVFLLLPLVIGLSVVACDVEPENSSKEESSSAESSASSEVKNLPAKQFNTLSEGNFKLEEFPNIKFSFGPKELNAEGNKYVYPLNVNGVKITEDRPRSLWAYDVNKDGYRELVFRYEKGSKYTIRSFDVKNMKEMEYKGPRQFISELVATDDGDLRVQAYAASTISKVVFDTAQMAYSEEQGFYFIWDNIYQFTDFRLDEITENGNTVDMINNVYEVKAETDYLFAVAAPREEGATLEITDFGKTGFNIYVNDEVYGVNKFNLLRSENNVHYYQVNFNKNNPVKEFTYSFMLPSRHFEVNFKIVE